MDVTKLVHDLRGIEERELNIVERMLQEAAKYKLEPEVVLAFGWNMAHQAAEPQDGGVERAAMNALLEWDL